MSEDAVEERNPRYVCYATAHGRSPDGMLVYDAQRFPGGKMAGFICWIEERWEEWERDRPVHERRPWATLREELRSAFDAWLREKVTPR